MDEVRVGEPVWVVRNRVGAHHPHGPGFLLPGDQVVPLEIKLDSAYYKTYNCGRNSIPLADVTTVCPEGMTAPGRVVVALVDTFACRVGQILRVEEVRGGLGSQWVSGSPMTGGVPSWLEPGQWQEVDLDVLAKMLSLKEQLYDGV